MPKKQSKTQKKVVKDVMHDYKHGDLKSGKGGKGGKVKSRKQAIAIAMHESGSSRDESKSENKKNLRHTLKKKRGGKTAGKKTAKKKSSKKKSSHKKKSS